MTMLRALALAACLGITACALLQPPRPTAAAAPLGPGEILSAQTAQDAVVLGKSTRAEVQAALGKALVIDFASGYEVWVYRERPPEKELVLLFAPSGVLTKLRVGAAFQQAKMPGL